ncbi:MAG: hypothetical protein U1D31_01495 [Patescibacteria group bacterium]|nr:hypothetical protein [bacterium]MDZ4240781.1 hypothetical protein [Patescibacteria group bacterium]
MNIRYVSFWIIVCVGLLVAIVQFLADKFFLYWQWWWLDVVTHFLGGIFVAALFIWAYAFFLKKTPGLLPTLLVVLAVGILWELFEYSTGMMRTDMEGYAFDTVSDIIMDVLGAGTLVYLLLVAYGANKNPLEAGF